MTRAKRSHPVRQLAQGLARTAHMSQQVVA
ncbi:MAG: hypothetical protein JWQ48_2274 [Conexibacter sp.]|nr:hypothetical protein [Conexibacter sp.]